MEPSFLSTVKLVLLGESSVGKSTLVTTFTTGEFHANNNTTVGAAFTTKEIEWVDSEDGIRRRVKFEIWDTAGQERYRSLAPMYYRNTDVALIVFDVTQPASKRKAQSWIDELQSYLEDYKKDTVQIRVVGNKMDLVDKQSLDSWNDASLVSAKTGEGVTELFMQIAQSIPLESFSLVQGDDVPVTAPARSEDSTVDIANETQKDPNSSCSC